MLSSKVKYLVDGVEVSEEQYLEVYQQEIKGRFNCYDGVVDLKKFVCPSCGSNWFNKPKWVYESLYVHCSDCDKEIFYAKK